MSKTGLKASTKESPKQVDSKINANIAESTESRRRITNSRAKTRRTRTNMLCELMLTESLFGQCAQCAPNICLPSASGVRPNSSSICPLASCTCTCTDSVAQACPAHHDHGISQLADCLQVSVPTCTLAQFLNSCSSPPAFSNILLPHWWLCFACIVCQQGLVVVSSRSMQEATGSNIYTTSTGTSGEPMAERV